MKIESRCLAFAILGASAGADLIGTKKLMNGQRDRGYTETKLPRL